MIKLFTLLVLIGIVSSTTSFAIACTSKTPDSSNKNTSLEHPKDSKDSSEHSKEMEKKSEEPKMSESSNTKPETSEKTTENTKQNCLSVWHSSSSVGSSAQPSDSEITNQPPTSKNYTRKTYK
ncbi:hypothetical protein [Mycoplasma feriruminatoris]|uniref:hypothetical protein n=1 Tax=Mycoplasma feriruminatoris TaxID=1179777 RepID=UPI00241E2822|nr:hypothetical protein [Mycoplasma feriruminatoris]WFQ94448.1 hypothetical protein MFERI15220_00527 [Mycoplasma feriruminatoris]